MQSSHGRVLHGRVTVQLRIASIISAGKSQLDPFSTSSEWKKEREREREKEREREREREAENCGSLNLGRVTELNAC